VDAPIAANRKTRQDEVREEQQQLKKLVLNYEQNVGEEEAAMEKLQIKAALMGVSVKTLLPGGSGTGTSTGTVNTSGTSGSGGGGGGGGSGSGSGSGGRGKKGNQPPKKTYYTPTSIYDK